MPNAVLYGFLEHKDIFAERISTANLTIVDTAIQASVDEHNRQMAAIMDLFVERTTEYKRRFAQMNSMRLQPLDDNGRARPVRVAGYYDVGWPIQQAGSAWGANYVARAKMSVGDANRITAAMLDADVRWMRDHVIAALFTDVPWTFQDEQWGDIIVSPLANGDTVTYQIQSGADVGATDDHNNGFAAAIDDGATNALIPIADDLREHPENSGEVVVLVPTNLKASITSLDTFVAQSDVNVRLGLGTVELVGTLPQALPGSLLGYERASKTWVSEWKALPNNYGVAVMTDSVKPLRMREDAEPELQGFKRVAERADHPFLESQWLRRCGFGAWNRIGAYTFVIGSGTYTVPAGFTTPMP